MKDWERKGMAKEMARRVAPFVLLQAKEERATERESGGERD